jgi:hypothetical protein
VNANDPLVAAAHHALRHFVHTDEASAAMHCAGVRYSPITFRLAEALAPISEALSMTTEVARVMAHVGQYAEDTGR